MKIEVYGIPNCDTVKKARKWLETSGRDYSFHDYKKEGADPGKLEDWTSRVGWEPLLNTRGTTFRKLSEDDKADIDREKAIALMAANPSMIKRPVVEFSDEEGHGILVGFKESDWETEL